MMTHNTFKFRLYYSIGDPVLISVTVKNSEHDDTADQAHAWYLLFMRLKNVNHNDNRRYLEKVKLVE